MANHEPAECKTPWNEHVRASYDCLVNAAPRVHGSADSCAPAVNYRGAFQNRLGTQTNLPTRWLTRFQSCMQAPNTIASARTTSVVLHNNSPQPDSQAQPG